MFVGHELDRTDITDSDVGIATDFSRHFEATAAIGASAEAVFAYADDPDRFSSHMTQSSWRMGGGRMQAEVDESGGRAVGSRIRMSGRVFGLDLFVDELVVERTPPRRKTWQTIGSPKLLVIGHYRMGFEVLSRNTAAQLRVYIDYDLPEHPPARWLGVLLADYYAQWCTNRMLHDAAQHFRTAA